MPYDGPSGTGSITPIFDTCRPRDGLAAVAGAVRPGYSHPMLKEVPISAYELCVNVFGSGDDIEALIRLAKGGECEWLELKAAMISRPQDDKPNEKPADGYWNVAKGVIALANTRGGAVIVGVEEVAGRPVACGLEACDPRKVIEKNGVHEYLRKEIRDRICPENGIWETGRDGQWKVRPDDLPRLRQTIEVCKARCSDHDVALILVKPIPERDPCLITLHNGKECLIRRTPGHIGEGDPVQGYREMMDYEKRRLTDGDDLALLWERFLSERAGARTATAPEGLEERIATYHASLQQLHWFHEIQRAFTDLD